MFKIRCTITFTKSNSSKTVNNNYKIGAVGFEIITEYLKNSCPGIVFDAPRGRKHVSRFRIVYGEMTIIASKNHL